MIFRHLTGAAFVGALVLACSSGGTGTTPTSSSTSSSGSSSGGSSSGGSSSGGSSSGTIGGGTERLVVLWSVFSGSPDYLYSYGGGTTAPKDIIATFGGPPPAEALNGGKLGIGIVAALNDGATLPEGKVDSENRDAILRAMTPMHAVIYKNTDEQLTSKGWELAFPQGYTCGKCIEAEAGFDTFEKDDCANMVLVPVADKPHFCNFT